MTYNDIEASLCEHALQARYPVVWINNHHGHVASVVAADNVTENSRARMVIDMTGVTIYDDVDDWRTERCMGCGDELWAIVELHVFDDGSTNGNVRDALNVLRNLL